MRGMPLSTSIVPETTHLHDASPLAWLYATRRTAARGFSLCKGSLLEAVCSMANQRHLQALELGKDISTGVRRPLFPTFSAGEAGPAQVQSADASRTLSSSLAGSFNNGDGVRCVCKSCSLLITPG